MQFFVQQVHLLQFLESSVDSNFIDNWKGTRLFAYLLFEGFILILRFLFLKTIMSLLRQETLE